MWIAFAGTSSRTGRVVLGIIGHLYRFGFSRMPFPPAGGFDVRAHFRVEEHDLGKWTPRAPQPYVIDTGIGREFAVIEDIGAILLRADPALRRDVAAIVGVASNLAIVEDRLRVSENEIDVAFNGAAGEVLAR